MTQERFEELIHVEGKPLGRSLNHDPRSRQYAFKADPVVSPLSSVRHNINVSPINQLNVGRCVTVCGTHALASDKLFKTLEEKTKTSLNLEFATDLYRETTRNDPWDGAWEPDDTGTDGLSFAKVLRNRKIISGWVYAFDPYAALTALQENVLMIGIMWKTGCDNPDANGLIHYTGQNRGGHEVLVIGYDHEKQLVEILNSWGRGWGKGGHCFMSVVDFITAIKNNGDVTILVPNTEPAPTPTPINDFVSEADKELVKAMEPWVKTIVSRITKSGKAKTAYETWKQIKGL